MKKQSLGPSQTGWALLLFLLILAAVMRFWQLGEWPPGLYRDEAHNGLDALAVLDGHHALFFTANNGREPAYIYLTALFVNLFGRTALAVRMGAAVVGTLTTWLVYKLADAWHGRSTAYFAAFVWAITLWPVHLSRIGLRTILLAPALAATFWLGTLAYRRQNRWLWLLAGLVYGVSFYTYLAARFTPVLLAAIGIYMLMMNRKRGLGDWAINFRKNPLIPQSPLLNRNTLWFGWGTAVALLPFAILTIQQPDLLLGRTGQVSILNQAVNGGDLWGTLWRNVGQALGMFLGQGDMILRHNPSGRPVFDWFMALPFLVGLGWSLKNWQRPSAMIGLLWTAVMLGPTILAADTPHFLRASGVLPGILILPAIGLARLWEGELIAGGVRKTAVFILATGSLTMTVRDYVNYNQSPDTGYLFEQAARTLAEQANEEAPGVDRFIDDRFWSGWPSIPFLVTNPNVHRFWPDAGLPPLTRMSQLFIWPHDTRDFIPPALPANALVWTETGPLTRGDLEPEPYPLYARYLIIAEPPILPPQASFDGQLTLHDAQLTSPAPQTVQVDLVWSADSPPSQPLAVFIHIISPEGTVAQNDGPPGSGNWPADWWRPGLLLHDRRILSLSEPFDPAQHQIIIGIYNAETGIRLPVIDPAGQIMGDSWELKIND